MSDTGNNTYSESRLNSPPEVADHHKVEITAPPWYTRRDLLLYHTRVLLRDMADWSTNELSLAPEYIVPYIGRLRSTGYPTLHAKNLLRLVSYWDDTIGMMEGMSDELLAIHIIQWESLNSHFISGVESYPHYCKAAIDGGASRHGRGSRTGDG